jgi:ubiquinone/menaquinone biosynthesis C-methylase UbiE
MTASKGYIGMSMEGFIARSYDNNAKKYSAELYRNWAEYLAGLIPDHSHVLEVAPGPGYLAIELAKRKRCSITALEISNSFVEIARANARRANVSLDVRQGSASGMPFSQGMFDVVMCTSSFKNFSEPLLALREMHRVVQPKGFVWLSDLRRDVSDETIDDFVEYDMQASGAAGFMMRYTFKRILRPRAFTGTQFGEMAKTTGFKNVEITLNSMDFEALLKKT